MCLYWPPWIPNRIARMSRHDRGLYEVLITEALAASLRELGEVLEARSTDLRAAEAADRIALHLSRVVQRAPSGLTARTKSGRPPCRTSRHAG